MNLKDEKCIPCQKKKPTLKASEIEKYIDELDSSWKITMTKKLQRDFICKDFMDAVSFINEIAKIAEGQEHHPNIRLYRYNHVEVEIYTHKTNDLHKADFILASMVDTIWSKRN